MRLLCDWDLADAMAGTPDVGPLGRWFFGVLVAALVVGWGVWCIADGHATMPTKAGPRELTGGAATIFSLLFVFAGVFLHFHFFWAPDKALGRFANLGKILSVLSFLVTALWLMFG